MKCAIVGFLTLGVILVVCPIPAAAEEPVRPSPRSQAEHSARQNKSPGRKQADKNRPSRSRKRNFAARGVQIGDKMPDLTVYTLDGKPHCLASAWKERDALIVTASLTCPVARRTLRRVEEIIRRIDDRAALTILYTIEAHPKTDPSPYRGREWTTPQNEREGILCRQPTSLADRLKLARQLKQRLGKSAHVLVDGMENKAWKALGGGPNMAVLIRTDRVVAAKQAWFDRATMGRSIEALAPVKRSENAPSSCPAGLQ